jgi:hypothetical protein
MKNELNAMAGPRIRNRIRFAPAVRWFGASAGAAALACVCL